MMFTIINVLDVDGYTDNMTEGIDYLTVDIGDGLHDYEVMGAESTLEAAEAVKLSFMVRYNVPNLAIVG